MAVLASAAFPTRQVPVPPRLAGEKPGDHLPAPILPGQPLTALAPMQDVTDLPFMRVMAQMERFGPSAPAGRGSRGTGSQGDVRGGGRRDGEARSGGGGGGGG